MTSSKALLSKSSVRLLLGLVLPSSSPSPPTPCAFFHLLQEAPPPLGGLLSLPPHPRSLGEIFLSKVLSADVFRFLSLGLGHYPEFNVSRTGLSISHQSTSASPAVFSILVNIWHFNSISCWCPQPGNYSFIHDSFLSLRLHI